MKLVYRKLEKSKIKAIVVDNIAGLYLPIAQHLTKYFDVSYHSVIQNPFPRMSTLKVGVGYDFRVVNSFWAHIDEYDLFIFPDIYFTDWASHLRKMGKLVWGGSESEILELDRKLFKQELKNAKLPVANTNYFVGIKALSQFLQSQEDKWIKISFYRGDMETFHHINWKQSEVWINDLAVKLGPLANTLEFMVEDGIESIAEIGSDGYLVNGKTSNKFMWGIEVKDLGYFGKADSLESMPQPIRDTYRQFQPITEKYHHTGFYSTEIRVGEDGNDYYTDPCMRAGMPPSNTYLELISNWGDIILGGARGEIVEPTFTAKYGCEIILKSNYCNKNYLPVSFDEKYKNNIKLKGSFILDGRYYVIPFEQAGISEMDAFGSIVVVGNEIDSMIDQALEIANSIDAYGLTFDENALNKAKSSLGRIEEALKIKF